MSSFDVKIRKITSVLPHPGADRLDLVQIGGYFAVCQKGIHSVNDKVLYVPEDTVFTDLNVARELKVDDYLTGKKKNRVKAIRLRGCLSQGICLPATVLEAFLVTETEKTGSTFPDIVEGNDYASYLKVEKYEEPIPVQMAGQARRWPEFLPHYNIENVKRPESFNLLQEGEEVVVTEKLHGTNIAIAIGPGLEGGEEAFVCSRNYALKEDANNVYWRAARQFGLIDALKKYWPMNQSAHFHDVLRSDNWTNVEEASLSLHGEVVGVQDLRYGIPQGEIDFYAFDLRANGKFVSYDTFVWFTDMMKIKRAPLLYRGPYNYDVINKLIQGNTILPGGHIKEGGVCKPVVERSTLSGERVQVKFISENYLLRSSGTEFH